MKGQIKSFPEKKKIKLINLPKLALYETLQSSLRKKKIKNMNTIIPINTCLTTIESKKQNEQTSSTETNGRTVGEMGKKNQGIEKYRLVATEQSRGCTVQHREYCQ